jgi:uncharacterized membrane protein YadS
MSAVNRKWNDGMLSTEDWWAVWLGLTMFCAGLASIWGLDLVGWMAKTKTWELTSFIADPGFDKWLQAAHGKAGKAYEGLSGIGSLIATYAVFTLLTCVGAYFQKLDVKKFFLGFTCIFFITWTAWIVGHEAHFKALKTGQSITQSEIYGTNVYCTTKVNKCTKQINEALKELGVDVKAGQEPDKEIAAQAVDKSKNAIRMAWGLQLGGGFSYMLALFTGLLIGNLFKGVAGFLKEAAKPEWFIKTAIVYLGIKLGVMSMKATGFAVDLALSGAAATFVAYLIFWPVVYTLGRRIFKLRRDASAVLASGISICGVSAAIATAGAIRAKPILPVAVSMLIVIFAMLELVVLPTFLSTVAPNQPIVNGAALGLTVKTDGADAAAGAILDELMVANHYRETGEQWESDWILSASILTKIWIDVFIGVWAFVLALIWVYRVERRPGQDHVGPSEIWFRFPKFVLGYFIAWFFYVGIAIWLPDAIKAATAGANIVQSPMRKMMFMLTFVAIGVITDFSKLKGMGKLALLYALALFAFIAPVGFVVAYIFHRGLMPPLAGS